MLRVSKGNSKMSSDEARKKRVKTISEFYSAAAIDIYIFGSVYGI
jgi:hypothetical protein